MKRNSKHVFLVLSSTYVVKLSFSSCRLSPSSACKLLSACPSPGPGAQNMSRLTETKKHSTVMKVQSKYPGRPPSADE